MGSFPFRVIWYSWGCGKEYRMWYQWRELAEAVWRKILCGEETSWASRAAAGDTETLERQRGGGRESELSQHAARKHFKFKQSACFYLTGRCFRVSASSSGQFVQLCDCDLSWSLFVGKHTLIWTALSIETHNIRKTLWVWRAQINCNHCNSFNNHKELQMDDRLRVFL